MYRSKVFSNLTMIARLFFIVAIAQLSSARYINNGSISLGITGGKEASKNSAKFAVVVVSFPTDPKKSHLLRSCGGSLLTSKHVLTAAHCIKCDQTLSHIIAGAHNFQKDEKSQQTVDIDSYKIHAQFDKPKSSNDIAILKLKSSVVLNKYVGLVKLPKDDKKDYVGKKATAYGWGLLKETNPEFTDVLHKVEVKVFDVKECYNKSKFGNVYLSDLCTEGTGKVGTCKGDSGGPLIYDGVQIGVIARSAGDECDKGDPSVYVRVTFYLPWIYTAIKHL